MIFLKNSGGKHNLNRINLRTAAEQNQLPRSVRCQNIVTSKYIYKSEIVEKRQCWRQYLNFLEAFSKRPLSMQQNAMEITHTNIFTQNYPSALKCSSKNENSTGLEIIPLKLILYNQTSNFLEALQKPSEIDIALMPGK